MAQLRHPSWKQVVLVAGLLATLLLGAPAMAITWTGGGDGTSWEQAANWDLGHEPLVTESVYINDAKTATITQAGEQARYLGLATPNNPAQSGTLRVESGSLYADYVMDIGRYGTGTITQTGGAVTQNTGGGAYMELAHYAGSKGTYDLEGGSFSGSYCVIIGEEGIGEFNVSGAGTTLDTNTIWMGSGTVATGDLNVSGGIATVNTLLQVGKTSAGTCNVRVSNDGQLNSSGKLLVGDGAVTTGKVYVSDTATLTTSGEFSVGNGGTGEVYVSDAASLTTSGSFVVGDEGTGEVTQTGGTVQANGYFAAADSLIIGYQGGSDGLYSLQGGSLTSKNRIDIGYSSTGALVQTGGVLKAGLTGTSYVMLGHDASGIGTLDIGGTGQCIASLLNIGEYGQGTLYVRDDAIVTVTTGSKHIRLGERSGANALFEQSGGTVTAGTVTIADNASNQGTYNLSGGRLNVGTLQYGAGTAAFNFTGGTLSADTINLDLTQSGGTLTCGPGGSTTINGDYFVNALGAQLDATGGSVTVTTVAGNAGFVGVGWDSTASLDHTAGTLSAPTVAVGRNNGSNGTLNVSGNAVVNTSYDFVVGGLGGSQGFVTIADNAQVIRTGGETNIGYSGHGTVTVTGGLFSTATNLFIGRNNGAVGVVNVSGGTAEAKSILVGRENGSKGTLSLSGNGTVNSTYDFVVGGYTGSQGFVTVADNAQLSHTGTAHVGYQGKGTVTQTGGSAALATLYLGSQAGGEGTYRLEGGSLNPTGHLIIGSLGKGTFEQTGGTLTMNSSMYVRMGFGSSGEGIMDLSGTAVCTGSLLVDVGENAKATLNVSDSARLNTGTLFVAEHPGVGTQCVVNQSGGTVEANIVRLAWGNGQGTYHLSGGTLDVGTLEHGAGTWAFDFTGGTLHAGTVEFDLLNDGGTLAPGASPGTTTINGGYVQTGAGTYGIEIGGYGRGTTYDLVEVFGTANLAGLLDVSLYGGLKPLYGDTFDVLIGDDGIALAAPGLALSYDQVHGNFLWDIVPAPASYGYGAGAEALRLTWVPEPGTALLLGSSLLALIRRRRRK